MFRVNKNSLEFKGTVKTRWGTRDELLQACKVAAAHGIDIIIDAVLNVFVFLRECFLFLNLCSTNLGATVLRAFLPSL